MKKMLIFTVVVLILGVSGFLFLRKNKKVVYQKIQPERGSIAVEFRISGTVQPRNRLEIKPQVAGRIESILVVEGQKVKKGEILAWMSSTERAALLDIARAKGEEELKKWEDTYKPTPIISPLDGFIIVRNKEPGQVVSLNDVILVMADKLIVEANVDETDLSYIKLGQKVNMFLDAYPENKFTGIVEHIAYESEIINNVTVYKIKILPIKTPLDFRSGMTATVEVVANQKNDVLLLPVEAIIEKDDKKFVMVETENKKPERRRIETGISNGSKIEIVSGITEDETILIPVKDGKKERRSISAQRQMMGIPVGPR